MIDNKTIRQVVINKALLPCTPGELEYHEAATAAGGYSVSFTTNVEGAVQDFVTVIEPKQSGSGDPSPDNVRPISGTDTLSFLHSIIKTPPSAPTIINVPLGQTVYGGEVDVVGGEVTDKLYKVSPNNDFTFAIDSQTSSICVCYFSFSTNNLPTGKNGGVCVSNRFSKNIPSGTAGRTVLTGNQIYLVLPKADATTWTTTEIKQWFADNPTDICYELATPTTAQITPVTVNTLKGKQKIENSKKFEFSLKYPIMVGGSCEISKQFMPIFYPNGKGVKHHGSTF